MDFLKDELKEYCHFQNLDSNTYESNSTERRNVERWIENLVNASIDLAKIILAAEQKKIPESYKKTLQLLAILPGFDEKTAYKLAKFSPLRNILAHEYLDIRFQKIQQFLQEAEPIYKSLIEFVTKFLQFEVRQMS